MSKLDINKIEQDIIAIIRKKMGDTAIESEGLKDIVHEVAGLFSVAFPDDDTTIRPTSEFTPKETPKKYFSVEDGTLVCLDDCKFSEGVKIGSSKCVIGCDNSKRGHNFKERWVKCKKYAEGL